MTPAQAQVWAVVYAAVLGSLAAVPQSRDGWANLRLRAEIEANAAVSAFDKA
jgi:hypothetical protein